MDRRFPILPLVVIFSFITLFAGMPSQAGTDASPVSTLVRLDYSDDTAVSLQFELDGLEQQQIFIGDDQFDLFTIDGETFSGTEGQPQLPATVRLIAIPPRSGVKLIVKNVRTSAVEGVRPPPRQPLRMTSDDSEPSGTPIEADSRFYRAGDSYVNAGFWPPEIARLGEPAILRGHRIIPVIINPVRWNAQTGEMQIIESAEIQLDFSSAENMVNLVENPDRPRPSRYADRLLRSIVVNPAPERDEVTQGGSIAYVFGSGGNWDNVAEELEPLIEWRRRMGWTVDMIRVGNTTSNAAVKNAIQDAYDEWEIPPEYIVICGDTDGSFPIAYWNHQSGANYPYESDHDYTQLEGGDNDLLPEAAIGRLVFPSTAILRGQVEKIIAYESDPYMGEDEDEAGWWLRGAVTASDERSGTSSINVCKWIRGMALDRGFTAVDELYWSNQNPRPDPSSFIRDNFADGISFYVFRGYINMNGFAHASVNQLRNERMLPFVIVATCNTGDYGEHIYNYDSYSERFAYYADGGAIGCIGAAGATHTAYNNLFCAATMKAPFVEEIYSQGWALMRGKMAMYSNFKDLGDQNHPENRNMEAWLTEFYIFNLMGDPAVDLYTGIPREMVVEMPEEIRAGESRFEAVVQFEDDESPAEGVVVCMYKPEEFQLVSTTDAEGRVVFPLDPTLIVDGEIQFTITGHNLFPYLETFEIGEAEYFIGAKSFVVDDDDEGESNGDGDETANPTERIELTVNIANFGGAVPDGNMTATLTTDLDDLEIIAGEADFDAAPDSGESEAVFVVDIGGGFPSELDAVFNLNVTIGDDYWNSAVILPVEGARFEFDGLEWDGDPLAPAGNAELTLSIRNIGERQSQDLTATLISRTNNVAAGDVQRNFDAIQVNESGASDGMFRLSANLFYLGGNSADLELLLDSEDGFRDTVPFSIIVGSPIQDQPFGPDKYSYVCFEDTDADEWEFSRPTFEWIEIDPNEDGDGTDTELSDTGAERDESTVVQLPFTFKYYGIEYDEITVCTNGWMAFGDRAYLNNFRNRRIPDGEVVPASLCPFWDDLLTTNDGGIYYWYNEEDNTFIIEWKDMMKLTPGQGRDPQTFQVILYDPRHHPSFTGDGDIVFQYLEINDNRFCEIRWDTPYATVGIVSPDMDDGLSYTYWGQSHPGADTLIAERAIKFTTLMDFNIGYSRGRVTDLATSEPIEDAQIFTTFGFTAETDENGYFFIDNMLADTARFYTFTATKLGWNDSSQYDIEVLEGDTIVVDFALRHPEFNLIPDEYTLEMIADTVVERTLLLSNDGNGPLSFDSKLTYSIEEERDDPDELLDILVEWNVSEHVDDERIQGVAFDGQRWIISGAQDGDRDNNWFYIFNRNGNEYLGVTEQPPDLSRYGIKDMDFYDGYLYCASHGSEIIRIDPETFEVDQRWESPVDRQSPIDVLTVTHEGQIIASKITGDVYIYDVDGEALSVVDSFTPQDPQAGTDLYKFGMAWFRDDPDGYRLYLMAKTVANQDGVHLYKVDIESGDVLLVSDFLFLDESFEGKAGITITPKWNNMVWVLAAVLDHPEGDEVILFELGPNASWLQYSPEESTLEGGESVDIELEFDTADLDTGRYGVIIEFSHNALGGMIEVPVNLMLVDSLIINDVDAELLPYKFGLSQNHPNPFNPATSIEFSIDIAGEVTLTIWDISGREIVSLQDGYLASGDYKVTFDAASLPNGIYFYRLNAGRQSATRKMVLIK